MARSPEPSAGTDLAALKTRADLAEDGSGDYIINGSKLWTSLASDSDYCWLAVRTDQEASKHGGLSMFLVDMKSQGIRIDPLELLSNHDINAVFFDEVRVPAENLVGGLNKGWKLITSQLKSSGMTTRVRSWIRCQLKRKEKRKLKSSEHMACTLKFTKNSVGLRLVKDL